MQVKSYFDCYYILDNRMRHTQYIEFYRWQRILADTTHIHPSLPPFGLSGGACMFIVLVNIVLPWRGEDIEDACGSLRDNA